MKQNKSLFTLYKMIIQYIDKVLLCSITKWQAFTITKIWFLNEWKFQIFYMGTTTSIECKQYLTFRYMPYIQVVVYLRVAIVFPLLTVAISHVGSDLYMPITYKCWHW